MGMNRRANIRPCIHAQISSIRFKAILDLRVLAQRSPVQSIMAPIISIMQYVPLVDKWKKMFYECQMTISCGHDEWCRPIPICGVECRRGMVCEERFDNRLMAKQDGIKESCSTVQVLLVQINVAGTKKLTY